MAFNKFSLILFARIIFIVVTGLGLAWLLQLPGKIFSSVGILLVLLLQIYGLIRYVNKTNAKLARFIIQLKNQETTGRFSGTELDSTFSGLTNSFDSIIEDISLNRRDAESKLVFYENIIQNVASGVIALNEKNQVVLFNTAAVKLLNIDPPVTFSKMQAEFPALLKELSQMNPGEAKLLLAEVQHDLVQFSFRLNEYILPGEHIRLYSFQNIKAELDDKELDSWQKLIRVLAHEIMNSITPVSTLTGVIKNTVSTPGNSLKPIDSFTHGQIKEIYETTQMIELRVNDIFNFVQNYRSLTSLPTPTLKTIQINKLFEKMSNAYFVSDSMIKTEIKVQPTDLTLLADEKLLVRMLDNLIVNAIHALQDISEPRIHLKAFKAKERVNIEVIDNGCGIPADIKDKIYIPFFTTKDNGTGIGLALIKQIMRLHSGEISVQSEPGRGTAFTLIF